MTKQTNDFRFKVVLTLRSPVVSAGTGASLVGIDASPKLIKKEDQYYPMLPGSLIQGNLKHSWKKLANITSCNAWLDDNEIRYWLGSEADQKTNEPARGKLRVSDTWRAENPVTTGQTRYRIKLDDQTGKVERGALQQIEVPHPVGKDVQYTGWFECTSNSEAARDLQNYIQKGLEFVPSLGAYKGIGFGVIRKVEVSPPELIEHRHVLSDCGGDIFGLSLKLDRPLSINRALNQTGNRFESLDYIPGSALKGVIANRMAQKNDEDRWPMLSKYLDKIRFSHASSVLQEEQKFRSVPIPMNLYFCKQNNGQGTNQVGLVSPDNPLPESGHISFQSDWKNKQWNAVNHLFVTDSMQPPVHQLRVRTAIDENAGTAEEGRLFSSEVIESDKHQWCGDVSLTAITTTDREQVRLELIDLLQHGLNGIGKLDACTTDIQINKERWPTTIPEKEVDDGRICILLMSDTRLFLNKNLGLNGTNATQKLHQYYSESWQSLSSGLLNLESFYAHQKLVGGEYYRRRFKQLGSAYNPWVVTCAGSIFYFKTPDVGACKKLLQKWQSSGLSVLEGIPEEWDKNPMVPGNGYGEILVNPVIDTEAIREVFNNE